MIRNAVSMMLLLFGVGWVPLCAHAEDPASTDWDSRISAAISIPDRVQANVAITRGHRELSEALRQVIGADGGANFHTWAVWGSFKAGESIRGEDIPFAGEVARNNQIDPFCRRGGWTKALPQCAFASTVALELQNVSIQISAGNRLVLGDIGSVSGRFIRAFAGQSLPDPAALRRFISGVPDELLKNAFTQYWRAKYEPRLKDKQELMLLGNLYAILHEHTMLQPIIERAMPWAVRIFTTELLLKFRVGDELLNVSEDVPVYAGNGGAVFPENLRTLGNAELIAFLDRWSHSVQTYGSRAADWSQIEDRMNFICSLFRTRHLKPELFELPQ